MNSVSLHIIFCHAFFYRLDALDNITGPPVKCIEMWHFFSEQFAFFSDPKLNFVFQFRTFQSKISGVYCLRLHIDADHKKPSDERMPQLIYLLLNKMLQLGLFERVFECSPDSWGGLPPPKWPSNFKAFWHLECLSAGQTFLAKKTSLRIFRKNIYNFAHFSPITHSRCEQQEEVPFSSKRNLFPTPEIHFF